MFVKSSKILMSSSPVFTTIQGWVNDYIRDNRKLSPNVSRLLANGILIGFNSNDFINPSCYKGFVKLYKCNSSKPKLQKKYLGKGIGKASLLGFKIVDYDHSMNYILSSKMEFLSIIKSKMSEEFPEYPSHLYLDDDDVPVTYLYNRDWEHIKGLNPQEKIVLANKHDEEPFLNSYYENDRGTFSNRTQSDEYNIRLESEVNVDIRDYDIRDYENDGFNDTFEVVDNIIREREITFGEARDGFDYGDYQEFSDIYTRTETRVEDYELYPVRINCLPKAIKKKGKSPYNTKLGVRSYIWHNMWIDPEPLVDWVSKKSPKYQYEMTDEEIELDEYNLPDNFWEEIEMAYQNR